MASLFHITSEIRAMAEQAQETGGELPPGAEEYLNRLDLSLESKVESWCAVIGELEAMAAARAAEAKRILQLADQAANTATRMRDTLKSCLEYIGQTKVETVMYKVRIQRAGGKPAMKIMDGVEIPGDYTVTRVEPNKDLIRKDLEEGKELPFAQLLPRGSFLVIK